MKPQIKKLLVSLIGVLTAAVLIVASSYALFATALETDSSLPDSLGISDSTTIVDDSSLGDESVISDSGAQTSSDDENSQKLPESTSSSSSAAQSQISEVADALQEETEVEPLSAAIVAQGNYNAGKNGNTATGITWELDEDGVFTFTSGGYFPELDPPSGGNATFQSTVPMFAQYSDQITKIVFTEKIKLSRTSYYIFAVMPKLESIENFNTLDVSSCQYSPAWFSGDTSLKTLDLSGMNFNNATNMSSFFEGCKSLESINFSGTKTPQLMLTSNMFANCSSLVSLDLSSLKLATDPSVEQKIITEPATKMFYGCTSLKEVDLSNFKIVSPNIASMFSEPALEKITLTYPITYGGGTPIAQFPNVWAPGWVRESDGVTVDEIYLYTANSSFVSGTYKRVKAIPPEITTESLPPATLGQYYEYQLEATGSPAIKTWEMNIAINGLTLNQTTGVISGIPTTSGTYNPSFTAKNGVGNGDVKSLLLIVGIPPTITTTALTQGKVGADYSATLAATGYPADTMAWSIISGNLPDGLGLNQSTGEISGKPTKVGTFTFTVQAENGIDPKAQKEFSITINQAPTITTESALPNGKTKTGYSQTLVATGTPATMAWSVVVGKLPDGITLDSATGVLSGKPTKADKFTFTIQAANGIDPNAQKEFTITIYEAPTITTETLPDGATKTEYSQTLAATGTPSAITWEVVNGALPDGLVLNSATGAITGTPTKVGGFTFTVEAKNGIDPNAEKEFTIAIYEAPTITTETLPDGATKTNYNQTLAAIGTPSTMAWAVVDGALPDGLMLDSATGAITGTPTKVGSFTFTVEAKNGIAPNAQKEFTITIYEAPTITTETLPDGATQTEYSQTLAATGTPSAMTWTVVDGTLPDGLALDSATGVISGVPTKIDKFTFTVEAKNGINPNAQKEFTIVVNNAPNITTETLPDGATKTEYKQTLTAIGTPSTMAWAVVDGALPDGLALDSATGVISGTPTKVDSFTFTVQAKNGVVPNAQKEFTITIYEAPTITTETLPDGATKTEYGQALAATGTPSAITWEVVNGALPDGLVLNSATGAITGTPTKVGGFTFTVEAKNGIDPNAEKEFTIAIYEAPTITTETLPDGATKTNYNQTLAAIGTPSTMAWAVVDGALPDGLMLDSATGAITGTPTKVGSFTFTVEAKNGIAPNAQKEFTITIYEAPTITTETLPDGATQTEYSQTLAATGTPSAMTWALVDGALPDGLTLDSATGVISGVPTKVATFTFTVEAKNGIAPDAQKELTINVYGAPIITTESLKIGFVNEYYTQELSAKATPEEVEWTIAEGSLPDGLALNSATGEIMGTPTQIGTSALRIKASNGVLPDGEKNFSITVFDDEFYKNSTSSQRAIQANTFAAYVTEVNDLTNDNYLERSGANAWLWTDNNTSDFLANEDIIIDKTQVKNEKGVYPVTYAVKGHEDVAVTAFVVVSDGDSVAIKRNPRQAIQASDFVITAKQVQDLANSADKDEAYRTNASVELWTWDEHGAMENLSIDTVSVNIDDVKALAGTYPVVYTTENGSSVTAYATVQTKDALAVDKQTKEVVQANNFSIKEYQVEGMGKSNYMDDSAAQAWSIDVASNTLNEDISIFDVDFSKVEAKPGNYPVVYKTQKGASVQAYVEVLENKFTLIKFNGNGADIEAKPSSLSIIEPDKYLSYLPEQPVRTGYTFKGWAYLPDAQEPATITVDTVFDGDTTLYAVWSINSYEISFDTQGGGENPESAVVQYNSLVAKPAETPSKKGHSFIGWFTQPSGGTYWNFDTRTMPAHDTILYAQYEANKYEVVFIPNNNENRMVSAVAYGTYVPVPTQPRLYGYTFLGWFDEDGKVWDFANTPMPDYDIVLSARWEHTKYHVTYLTYDLKELSSYTLYASDKVPAQSVPYVGGHHFAAWVEAGTDHRWNTYNAMPDRDLVLVATYDKNPEVVSSSSSKSTASKVGGGTINSKESFANSGDIASLVQASESDKTSIVNSEESSSATPASPSSASNNSNSTVVVPDSNSTWSLLALILTVVSVALSAVAVVLALKVGNRKILGFIGALIGIVTVILFFVYNELGGTMVFFTKETLVIVAAVVIQIITVLLTRKKKESDEQEE